MGDVSRRGCSRRWRRWAPAPRSAQKHPKYPWMYASNISDVIEGISCPTKVEIESDDPDANNFDWDAEYPRYVG